MGQPTPMDRWRSNDFFFIAFDVNYRIHYSGECNYFMQRLTVCQAVGRWQFNDEKRTNDSNSRNINSANIIIYF